jgi:hypothetical protein
MVPARPGIFDRITRLAMQLVGIVVLALGILLAAPGILPIRLGTWLIDKGEGK